MNKQTLGTILMGIAAFIFVVSLTHIIFNSGNESVDSVKASKNLKAKASMNLKALEFLEGMCEGDIGASVVLSNNTLTQPDLAFTCSKIKPDHLKSIKEQLWFQKNYLKLNC